MTQQELDKQRAQKELRKDDLRNPPVMTVNPVVRITAVFEADWLDLKNLHLYQLIASRLDGELRLIDVMVEKKE